MDELPKYELDDDELLGFLKGYADFLQADVSELLKQYAPYSTTVDMAGGRVRVLDKNGNAFGAFCYRHTPDGGDMPYSPSMPIGPLEVAVAEFTVDALNIVFGGQDGQPTTTPA